jgi:hypothetical protein
MQSVLAKKYVCREATQEFVFNPVDVSWPEDTQVTSASLHVFDATALCAAHVIPPGWQDQLH